MYYRTTGCYYDFLLKLGHTLFIFVYVSSALDSTHCYSTRSNLKQMGPLRFCLPVCLGIHRNLKQKSFLFVWGIFEIIPFIHFYPLGWSLRHMLDKVPKWHFLSTSNKGIWPKRISNFMQGSKSAILAIFQTGPWWPCSVSAALKNPSQEFKNFFCFGCR